MELTFYFFLYNFCLPTYNISKPPYNIDFFVKHVTSHLIDEKANVLYPHTFFDKNNFLDDLFLGQCYLNSISRKYKKIA